MHGKNLMKTNEIYEILNAKVIEQLEKGVFFGYVEGFENEWGYFSLEELSSVVGPLNMKIERDKNFTPTKFKDLKRLNNE